MQGIGWAAIIKLTASGAILVSVYLLMTAVIEAATWLPGVIAVCVTLLVIALTIAALRWSLRGVVSDILGWWRAWIETKLEIERSRTHKLQAGKHKRDTLVLPDGRVYVAALGHAPVENVAHTYSPKISVENGGQPTMQTQLQTTEPMLLPKGRLDLDIGLIIPGQILLAMLDGQPKYVTFRQLCHLAIAGSTGNGKDIALRLAMAQVLLTETATYLLDPHYADIDPHSGDDWRPIRARLKVPPIFDYEDIATFLEHIATKEIEARKANRRSGKPMGVPMVICINELAAIIAHAPEVTNYMMIILREARKLDILLIVLAQDFLVKTIGGTGAVRDCYRSALYLGGDATTAKVLLDTNKFEESGLGKGIAMLRSAATPEATRVQLPYMSNDGLYSLLGPPDTLQRPLLSGDHLIVYEARVAGKSYRDIERDHKIARSTVGKIVRELTASGHLTPGQES